MQLSIINLSQVKRQDTFRIDAEYWHPQLVEISSKIKGNISLGNVVKEGYRVVYETTQVFRGSDFENAGLPKFLQATDIDFPIININQSGYVSDSDWVRYTKGRAHKGEVLIEVKGNVQKVAIVPDDFPEKVLVSGTLYKLTVNHLINKYFLTIFLSCNYGQMIKRRLISNIATPFISKNELYNIPLPQVSDSFQMAIEHVYKLSVNLINNSKHVYQQAQAILLAELSLTDWRPEHRLTFVADYSDTVQAGRIDADYFQPKYEEIIAAIRGYDGGWDRLGNLVAVQKCVEVGSGEYLPSGVPFVRVSNLSPFEITTEKYISEKLYRDLAQHQPKKGEILLSKDATPGIAYYLNETPSKMIPSGGILRLKSTSDKINNEYLTLVLNSIITKQQVNRDAGGSIILHWLPGQVKEVVIPLLPEEKQTQIQRHVIDAFALRKQSKHMLEYAKRAVEMAIEKDESRALAWLEKETDKNIGGA